MGDVKDVQRKPHEATLRQLPTGTCYNSLQLFPQKHIRQRGNRRESSFRVALLFRFASDLAFRCRSRHTTYYTLDPNVGVFEKAVTNRPVSALLTLDEEGPLLTLPTNLETGR
jgi:hypothetical protein